jgi:hypothetical protein
MVGRIKKKAGQDKSVNGIRDEVINKQKVAATLK